MGVIRVVIALLLLLIACSPSYAENVGQWIQRTPEGQVFTCERVTGRSRLLRVLQEAGWDVNEGIPRIDWDRQHALVVAPPKSYDSSQLVLSRLKRTEDVLELQYGWQYFGGKRRKRLFTRIKEFVTGTSTEIRSSRVPAEPETLVVSYGKHLEDGLKVRCRNLGKLN